MIPDPNDEIRLIRDRLSEGCRYDLDRIFAEARRQQQEAGVTSVSPKPGLPADQSFPSAGLTDPGTVVRETE